MKEDVPSQESGLRQIIRQNQFGNAHDFRFGLRAKYEIKDLDLSIFFGDVMDQVRY
jgi:hypothetical protein